MKRQLDNILKLILMATVIAAMPVCAFAASSNGSHVREILFVGIAIAFAIDMAHEAKRGKRK